MRVGWLVVGSYEVLKYSEEYWLSYANSKKGSGMPTFVHMYLYLHKTQTYRTTYL